MQKDMEILANRMGALELRVKEDAEKRDELHSQNRRDIHDLRGTLQTQFERLSLSFSLSIEKMSDRLSESIDKAIKPIAEQQKEHSHDIRSLQIQWAKATGWLLGGAAVSGFVFEAAKIGLERIIK